MLKRQLNLRSKINLFKSKVSAGQLALFTDCGREAFFVTKFKYCHAAFKVVLDMVLQPAVCLFCLLIEAKQRCVAFTNFPQATGKFFNYCQAVFGVVAYVQNIIAAKIFREKHLVHHQSFNDNKLPAENEIEMKAGKAYAIVTKQPQVKIDDFT
jgi:amino acid permease